MPYWREIFLSDKKICWPFFEEQTMRRREKNVHCYFSDKQKMLAFLEEQPMRQREKKFTVESFHL